MLRRQPTTITLTAEDIEVFKQLLSDQQKQRDQMDRSSKNQDEIAVDDSDPDDIFMGRSLVLNERKRRREIDTRLGLVTEEGAGEKRQQPQQQTEANSSSEPLFKRVHL